MSNHGEQSSLTAYTLKEFVNLPPSRVFVPNPPLRAVYPEYLRNTIAVRRKPTNKHNSLIKTSPLPSSLPSIVHDLGGTSKTEEYRTAQAIEQSLVIQRSHPLITTSYGNKPISVNEKVVVKVVKAPGWYLNNKNERESFLNALKSGLLSQSGNVYVNKVQNENT